MQNAQWFITDMQSDAASFNSGSAGTAAENLANAVVVKVTLNVAATDQV